MDIAKTAKTVSTVSETIRLVKLIVGLVIITIIFFILPLPIFIPLGFFVIGGIFIWLSATKIKRVKNLDLNKNSAPMNPQQAQGTPQVNPNEKVLAAVYGIMSKQSSGTSYLGVGKLSHPENTLMVTNGHIMIILIPMGGDGQMIEGMPISMANSFVNKGKIREKGELIIQQKNAQEIALSNQNNIIIPFSNVVEVNIKTGFNRGIKIKTTDGKKYAYAIQDKESLLKVKQMLSYYINVK